MIDFSTIPPTEAFKSWVNFVAAPSKDGCKSYICKDPNNPHVYFKSTDVKSKMTALAIIDKMAELMQDGNLLYSIQTGQEILGKFKKSFESHYYRGFLGLIRKIASKIFKRYRFENSLCCKKITKVEEALNLQKSSFQPPFPQIEKSPNPSLDTKKKLIAFSKEKGFSHKDVKFLADFESCWGEFFNRKQQDIQQFNQERGLYSSHELRTLMQTWTDKTETLEKLNLNPSLKFAWYWMELEGFYTNENRDCLIDMAPLFPAIFQQRHAELIAALFN